VLRFLSTAPLPKISAEAIQTVDDDVRRLTHKFIDERGWHEMSF
jgi:hypothetical protein